MPSHNLHDLSTCVVTIITTPIVATAALRYGADLSVIFLVSSGFLLGGLSGLILTPDLDVNQTYTTNKWGKLIKVGGCISFSRVKKWAGPIIGAVWENYWLPYGKWFGHRGISHTPLLGTLTRVAYGCVWLLPLLAMPYAFSLAWLAGLAWSDFWHFILDELDKLLGGAL